VTVSVVVDDVDSVASRVEAAGVSVSRHADGTATIQSSALTGVPLELRADDGAPAAPITGPYRRINHLVVAVNDDEAAKDLWAGLFGAWPPHATAEGVEVAHHLPVGIAWFGLTSAGTNADALAKFIERRGEGIYALAIVADDQPGTVAALEQRGARVISTPASGQTFIHPATTHGILIDVVPERHPSRI
jgi:hypothetical protein